MQTYHINNSNKNIIILKNINYSFLINKINILVITKNK